MRQTLKIHEADNVAVALTPLVGAAVHEGVTLARDIPPGHKFALRAIRKGEPVLKYGYPIGIAAADIAPGEHVHTHNVQSGLRENLSALSYERTVKPQPKVTPTRRTFQGYRRKNGRAGTRNEIWIVNTVGCVNHASGKIAEQASRLFAGQGIDGVHAFTHPFGCSQLGDDMLYTQKVLAGLVNHPNAAAVLILGLGCENNQMKLFLEQVGPIEPGRVIYFNAQEVSDEVEEGVQKMASLVDYASQFQREEIPSSELILGMKCGGSDGFSGITANPLVGRVADRHCAAGGTTLLTEVPEMFGAEQMLLERAADRDTFQRTIDLVNNFRDYFRKYDQPIDENPSPGNKDGGITTLAEKSLGCVQKGGVAPIKQVLGYGEPAKPGLGGIALLNAPGNDGVSSTAMTIAGAHSVLFTTGRGNPMGFPVPTIKISTNTDLAKRKPQWIDFDAGILASEGADLDQAADRLFDLVLNIASGTTLARNEKHGWREIAIWKNGVTL